MVNKWCAGLIPISFALFSAADQPWKDKQFPQWSEDDARQVLTDSPWAKPVTPAVKKAAGGSGQRGGRGGIGRGGIGVGMGGVGIGGGGMGGRGSRGGVGGRPRVPDDQRAESRGSAPQLTVRWESALPVQEAELKVHDTSAPAMEEGSYAIVVVGLPSRFGSEGSPKPQGELKPGSQKSIKASNVRMISRDDGVIAVFQFPRSKEITLRDKQVAFEAHLGSLEIKQTFSLSEMTWAGKLEI